MIRNIIFALLFVLALSPLGAELVSLKSVKGIEVDFRVKTVRLDGVVVQTQASYEPILIKWNQLDLKWLEENRPLIWERKQEARKLAVDIAYGPFQFGQTRFEVFKQVEVMGGINIPNKVFSEKDRAAQWVCLDPNQLRKFMRFSFDGDHLLSGIEFHMNFDRTVDVSTDMKEEWASIVEMVENFGVNAQMDNNYPKNNNWRFEGDGRYITNKWKDNSRAMELGLESKRINFPEANASPQAGSEITFFGLTTKLSSRQSVSVHRRTDWLVYRSNLKAN